MLHSPVSSEKEEIEHKEEIDLESGLPITNINDNDNTVESETNNYSSTISLFYKGITVGFVLAVSLIFVLMQPIHGMDIAVSHYNQKRKAKSHTGAKRNLFSSSDDDKVATYKGQVKLYTQGGVGTWHNPGLLNAALDYFKQQQQYTFSGTTYCGISDTEEGHQWVKSIIQQMRKSKKHRTEFSFDQFRSTSTNPIVAAKHLFQTKNGPDSVDFKYSMYIEFRLKKAANIRELSLYKDEDEILLGSQDKFIVHQIEQINAREFFQGDSEPTILDGLNRIDMAQAAIVSELIEDGQRNIVYAVLEQVVK